VEGKCGRGQGSKRTVVPEEGEQEEEEPIISTSLS